MFKGAAGKVLADVLLGGAVKGSEGRHLFITAAGMNRFDWIDRAALDAIPGHSDDLLSR
jgi:hypothetical protein